MGEPEREADNWLVLGASGAVGRELLRRLGAAVPSVPVIALTRGDTPAWAATMGTVAWRRGDLFRDRIAERVDTILSAGPLDGLVAWLARDPPPALRRVVALSSTSVHVKHGSPDAAEREVARRLRDAEAALAAQCAARSVRWTVLRPTLIYGGGADRNLGAIARVAERLGFFALPRDARGLRQPVLSADVAAAMLAALEAPTASGRAYDLPGGETLAYDAMVDRLLAALPSRPRLLRVSPGLFRGGAAVVRRIVPALRGATPAVIARMATDLAFDASEARRDFGYDPQGFEPAVLGERDEV
jgi:nucleoside-diphosphate-sugar epimerase